MGREIHPTAIVDPKAELGEDVVIGPYCIVHHDVTIGDGCRLDPYVQILSGVDMGANNHIHSYAFLGGDPQHLGYKGEKTRVSVGSDNIIREFATIHRGTAEQVVTSVGSHCLIMSYVHIAHDCRIGNHVVMANLASLSGHVEIGDHAVISAMTGIHQFVRIGEYAFIGAMGGFVQDVPPYMLATGVRGRLHGPNTIGLKRAGFSSETCRALKNAYHTLFRSGMSREEALRTCETDFPDVPEVQSLITFTKNTKRGITTASKGDTSNE